MAKYNYSRKGLKGLTPFPFLGEVKTRLKAIEAAPDTMPRSIYNANILAAKLHPAVQHVRIAEVVDHGGAKSFTLVPDVEKGTAEMAYFRASQYVSVALNIDGAAVNKPYTIRSGPKDALGSEDTSYTLTIKLTEPSYASKYILDTWKQGDSFDISGPLGDFYYQDLRDAKHVVAIAGGSGITPFYSMASAIADGIEDCDMTILYGSRTADGILLRDEIEAVAARSNGRVRVVHVLSHEEKEGYEHGFITAELIKKYAPAVRRLSARRGQRRFPRGEEGRGIHPHCRYTRREADRSLQGGGVAALGDGARGDKGPLALPQRRMRLVPLLPRQRRRVYSGGRRRAAHGRQEVRLDPPVLLVPAERCGAVRLSRGLTRGKCIDINRQGAPQKRRARFCHVQFQTSSQ